MWENLSPYNTYETNGATLWIDSIWTTSADGMELRYAKGTILQSPSTHMLKYGSEFGHTF